ncbi:AbiJ-NTD4 domain-containing protein [Bacteroides graminisolvens]|uniref:HEPN AbiJ-N-terminal domain-containing protein n=1 Tax=Bacteroides graminisolvens DSM 19988 = JCM 15093 TaxID=1121097 RepID=A0A069D647_9BACE|nr:hypothetical protein [Bacteroides graminisolvens]GAK35639.1 hypothetical protein JCM15093_746 [Bacteroides graminisolvens DSM 19988 = JCM 15093]
MALFSERNGYVKVSDVIIKETITPEIENAIINKLEAWNENISGRVFPNPFIEIERAIWTYYLNKITTDFLYDYGEETILSEIYIKEKKNEWYRKLDYLEFFISTANIVAKEYTKSLCDGINHEFERLNYAYRIVENKIIPLTSEEEIKAIEVALTNENDSVRFHLNKALELLAQRPEGDYRNSIKESISAVEAFIRETTGEKDLKFNMLAQKGIELPSVLRQAFEKLYGYTCDKTTGIRHALMDDTHVPGAAEATFMIISCSAFINYLTAKKNK